MKCPTCGAAKLVRETRDLPYVYKGQRTVLPKVTGEFCPACGEGVLAMPEVDRIGKIALAFNQQVNATKVNPAFIVKVRKKLALDQKQAAELFGGGVNAFSRYETGKTKPPLALVQLLRLLDKHPEQLEELRR